VYEEEGMLPAATRSYAMCWFLRVLCLLFWIDSGCSFLPEGALAIRGNDLAERLVWKNKKKMKGNSLRLCAAPASATNPLAPAYARANDGCWAGWQCSFDSTGKVKPIDSKFLSDAAIEWGDVPTGFELLTMEEAGCRKFVLLYPEDGCACENLYGELTASDLCLQAMRGDADAGVFTSDNAPGDGGQLWYLRTTFITGNDRRTRLSLRFDTHKRTIASIRMAQERRWETDPGALNIPASLAKGGGRTGLDATFVAQAIQSKRCFADVPIDEDIKAIATDADLLLPGDVAVRIDEGGISVGLLHRQSEKTRWVTRKLVGGQGEVSVA
jgi:hypothetical protein